MSNSWVKFKRSREADELLKDPKAWTLFSLIARRAKRTNEFNIHDLNPCEALIGDYDSCGLTRSEYRAAIKRLVKWKFVTIKTTNKGTIAKIINSNIFDINIEDNDQQTTNKQPTNDHQTTTNKNVKNGLKKNTLSSKNSTRGVCDFIPFDEIISYLNQITGKHFTATNEQTRKHIKVRWNEGHRFDDFKRVIDTKAAQWLQDPERNKYLRPETLFSPKFEGYLNESTNIRPDENSEERAARENRERLMKEIQERSKNE